MRIAPVVMTPDTELVDQPGRAAGALSGEIGELTLEGEDISELTAEVKRLERRIGDLSVAREQAAGTVAPVGGVEQLVDALGSRPTLDLDHVSDRTCGELVGLTGSEQVHLGGSARLRFLAHHLLSGLRRDFMLRGRSPNHPSHVKEMVLELAKHLLAPLAGKGPDVVIAPPPNLVSLPWNAIGRCRRAESVAGSGPVCGTMDAGRSPGSAI